MPTYTPLQSIEISSNTYSLTFSNIDQSYTDLVLVMNGTSLGGGPEVWFNFNNDVAANYSRTYILGDGSTASTGRTTSTTSYAASSIYSTNTTIICNIPNYSSTNTYKTILSKTTAPSAYVVANTGLWRSTAAINSITIAFSNIVNVLTVDLYGVRSGGTSKASGGDIVVSDGTYWYHAFLRTGRFTPVSPMSIDVLTIAGGGGATGYLGGGSGAGGLLYSAAQSFISTDYIVTVGAGGAGQSGIMNRATPAQNGTNSSVIGGVLSLVATGGGGGGGRNDATPGSGGSAGGAGSATTNNATRVVGQGNLGGLGTVTGSGGGGGGAGAAGGNAPSGYQGGSGGAGLNTYSSWASATGTGVSGYYAGGGGGGSLGGTNSTGGAGGGGAGANGNGITNQIAGVAGTANTGGGAGGGSDYDTNPVLQSSGGSGIVIMRYAV
jgi:hypothetical protein